MEPRERLRLAVLMAHRFVLALGRGATAGDGTVDGRLVGQVLTYARQRSGREVLDEAVAETRDRLSRPGCGRRDIVQATLDWSDALHEVLREGQEVPAALLGALDDDADQDQPSADSAEARDARSEVLANAAFREAAVAQHRGDRAAARQWWHFGRGLEYSQAAHMLSGDGDQPPPGAGPSEKGGPGVGPVRRPVVDLSTPHRDPRVAALLNASGLGAGYVYLGRWWRAGITWAVTAAVLWFAAANGASRSPGLWFTIIGAGVSAMVYDAWRLGRPPHRPPTIGMPFPRRSALVGVLLIVLVGTGFAGYRVAGQNTLDAARAAHRAGDCATAVNRYDHVVSRYELTLTSVVRQAAADSVECRNLLRGEEELAGGNPGGAIAAFDRNLAEFGGGPVAERARAGRAEAYLVLAGLRADSAVRAADADADDTETTAYYIEEALTTYTTLVTDHPDTTQAAAVPQAVADLYAAVTRPFDEERYCDAIPVLDQFQVLTPAPATSVTDLVNESLPEALYECGLARYEDGDYRQAMTHLTRLTTRYPDHRRTAAAADTLIAAEVANTRERGAGELGQPQEVGSAPSGTATVEIINDSPYPLELLASGPVAETVTVEACPDCRVRNALAQSLAPSCGLGNVPTVTLELQPGTYGVVVRTRSGAVVTPYYGSWQLRGGVAYSNCFYVSEF